MGLATRLRSSSSSNLLVRRIPPIFSSKTRPFPDVPQIPDDLQKLSSTSDSLLLGWRPRFNGGYAQTFEIEHRMLDPFAGTISKSNPVSIMISNATRIEDVKMDGTADWLVLYNITGLKPLSTYYIRARSSNVKVREF